MKSNTAPNPVQVSAAKVRTAPASTDPLLVNSTKPAPPPEASSLGSDAAPESSNINEEGKCSLCFELLYCRLNLLQCPNHAF